MVKEIGVSTLNRLRLYFSLDRNISEGGKRHRGEKDYEKGRSNKEGLYIYIHESGGRLL